MNKTIRRTVSFGVPWENAYRYVQAVRLDNTVYVSGQLSHTPQGEFVAPAKLDENGKPTDFSNMEAQMRQTYQNAKFILGELGASLDDVVEETLFVMDVPSAFSASAKVRPGVYGQEVPQLASNLIGVSALSVPEQLIEISFRAEIRP